MVSANNVDQELGWCREEYKKIGVEYAYFRHAPENNWYPHYIHNLDNLIRFGGLYPPIHVHADIRRTVLLGATWVYEGGCMAVRADDELFRMKEEGLAQAVGLAFALVGLVAFAAGATVVANPNQRAAFAARPADQEYPACSRTVTDNCVQTYERRRR